MIMEAPKFYHQSAGFSSTLDSKPSGGSEHFMVEDLLDFSNDDNSILAAATANDVVVGHGGCDALVPGGNYSTEDSSSISAGSDHPHNFNSLDAAGSSHFCIDLSVPYDELAELEWLSNFVEESFSSEDLQKLHLISGMTTRSDEPSDTTRNSQADRTTTANPCNTTITNSDSNPSPIFHPEMMSVPAKARSKRSRAAPMSWASRLLVLSSSTSPPPSPSAAASTLFSGPKIVTGQPKTTGKTPSKPAAPRKRVEGGEANGEGRKCLHCATDKTPQWRTGPMGPKTLCNACGVRYKSGRLVPEYRPAASPTFVLTKHSNSHRKVLELRRQKELLQAQQPQQHFLHHHQGGMVFDVSSSNGDDYLIHQHVGPDFRQLI